MNIVDYIIIAFVFLGAVTGYRRGFVAGLVSFFSWVAALAGAFFFCRLAVAWLDEHIGLTRSLMGVIRERLPVEAIAQKGILTPLSSTGFGSNGFTKYIQEIWAAPSGSGGLADVLSEQAASLLANSIVFAALVVVIFIVLRILAGLASRRLNGTLLGFFNRMVGMFFGLTVNIIAAALIVGLFTPWIVLGSWESGGILHNLAGFFGDSLIAPYFNCLFLWVTGFLAGMPL